MHLVDRDRAVLAVCVGSAFLEPGGVIPGEGVDLADDGGVVRRGLEVGAVGITLEMDVPVLAADLEFVEFTLLKARDEDFPYAGGTHRTHRVVAAVPVVEVADHGDAGGAGGPEREGDTLHTAAVAQMGAQLGVDPVFVALVEEIEVLGAERRQETIGVMELADLAVVFGRAQHIAEDLGLLWDEHLEETLRGDQLHRPGLAVGLVHHLALRCTLQKGAHHDALGTRLGGGVHAQPVMGLSLRGLKEFRQFGGGDQHERGRFRQFEALGEGGLANCRACRKISVLSD